MTSDPEVVKNREPAKVLLVTGFLGSGKTTLVRNILDTAEDLSGTLILVNEFGQIGIDGQLLRGHGSEVVELANGCICCTLQADLIQTLRDISESFQPRRIIIESTGVAEPAAVVSALNDPVLRERLKLHRTVTVLDARCWLRREALGSFFLNQLRQADLILLNKVDLMAPGEVPDYVAQIREVVPDCSIIPVAHCRVDPESIWSPGPDKISLADPVRFFAAPQGENGGQENGHHHHDHDHHHGDQPEFVSFGFRDDRPFDEGRFGMFLESLPWEAFRLKGAVRFAERTSFLNYVAGRADWLAWDGEPDTNLVLVGWQLDTEDLVGKLKACLLPG